MVTVQVKHIKPEYTRDFNGLEYDSEIRAQWIRDNKDKYFDVAKITYLYCTKEKAMNLAYTDTNSVDEYWGDSIKYRFSNIQDEGERVTICPLYKDAKGHRSTSVGDIFRVNGVEYFVDSYEFTAVDGEEV